MSFFISDAIAEAGAAASQPDPLASLLLPIGLVVLFYFFLIRPQSKRQKEHRQMLTELQKGEEVITSGGILGKITKITDDFITLEIADTVSLTIQKKVRCRRLCQKVRSKNIKNRIRTKTTKKIRIKTRKN